MQTNIGLVDQVIRIVSGLVLIVLFATGVIGSWGLLGLVLLATGLLRFCPLYRLIGIHTCVHSSKLP
jgi:hypothetical protein